MAGYSGDFDFRSDDEESVTLNQRQRLPPEAVAPVVAAPAPPLPLPSPPGDGPRPMLYIKSDRLTELSRRMPVNQDRPALVHGLIEAYGLLEVRGRPPLQSACSRQLTQMHAARHRSQTSGLLLGSNEPCLHLSRISSLAAKLTRDLCHQSQPASPLTGTLRRSRLCLPAGRVLRWSQRRPPTRQSCWNSTARSTCRHWRAGSGCRSGDGRSLGLKTTARPSQGKGGGGSCVSSTQLGHGGLAGGSQQQQRRQQCRHAQRMAALCSAPCVAQPTRACSARSLDAPSSQLTHPPIPPPPTPTHIPRPAISLYELAALTAGGSLAAAAGLCSGRHRLAVHLDGGRHHARKAAAAGFCYVNDVVRCRPVRWVPSCDMCWRAGGRGRGACSIASPGVFLRGERGPRVRVGGCCVRCKVVVVAPPTTPPLRSTPPPAPARLQPEPEMHGHTAPRL
jgi:hypothetical protein